MVCLAQGHPVLNITYKWYYSAKGESVFLAKTQDGQTFKLPMAVDIYAGGKKERHKVWVSDKADTLTFDAVSKPDLVNVDGDKTLLCVKTDNKSLEESEFQYFNAPLYLDRFEAINAAAGHQSDKGAQKVMIAALKDKYFGLRIKTIGALNMSNDDIHNAAALPILTSLAQTDENTLVRAAAITALGKLKASGNMDIFKQALASQSYAIQAAALNAIGLLDPQQALTVAKGFENDNKGALTVAVINVYAKNGNDEQFPYVMSAIKQAAPQAQFNMIRNFSVITGRVSKPEYAHEGIVFIRDFGIKYKQFGVAPVISGLLGDIKAQRTKLNDDASAKASDDAVKAINDAK